MKKYILIISLILFTPLALLPAYPLFVPKKDKPKSSAVEQSARDCFIWNDPQKTLLEIQRLEHRAATAIVSTSMSNQEKLEAILGDKYWSHRKKIIQDMILNQQISVNTISYQSSETPLNDSTRNGDAGFTEYLLQQNADVTRTDCIGRTPLIATINRLKFVYCDTISTSYNKIIKMLIFSHTDSSLKNIIHETGGNESYLHTKNLIIRTLAEKEIWHQLVSHHISQDLTSIVAEYCKHDLLFIEDDVSPILPENDALPMELEEIDPTQNCPPTNILATTQASVAHQSTYFKARI